MQTSTQLPASQASDAKKSIKRIRSRLERWELTHLRELAATLHQQLEQALERAERAESDYSSAEHRADMFMDMQREMDAELRECGEARGITQDGQLVLVSTRQVCDDFGNLVQVAE